MKPCFLLTCAALAVSAAQAAPNCALTNEDSAPSSPLHVDSVVASRVAAIPCQTLGLGQSRQINLAYEQSPTSNQAEYKLTRLDPKTYEASVNLQFRDKDGNTQSELVRTMGAVVSTCLARVNRALNGPNGEKLLIHITDPKDPAPPPPILITVQTDVKARGDDENYTVGMDCATFLHETLHHLGLPDEYRETKHSISKNPDGSISWVQNPELPAWDCRSPGPADSIMRDPRKAFERAFPLGDIVMVVSCSCSSPKCKQAFLHPHDAGDCPEGSVESENYAHPFGKDLDVLSKDGLDVIDPSHFRMIKGNTPAQGKSLLYPSEFNAIVHPGCSQTLPFYECSINSRSTSQAHNGEGCVVDPASLPSYCRDGSYVTKSF